MKFTKLNSNKTTNVNVFKYQLDWKKIKGSKPEIEVISFLKPYWHNDLCLSQFRIPGSKLRCDFINLPKKIVIEISPKGTHSFNKFFHKNEVVFFASLKREISKEEWCIKNGFKFVELDDASINNLTKKMFKEKFDITL